MILFVSQFCGVRSIFFRLLLHRKLGSPLFSGDVFVPPLVTWSTRWWVPVSMLIFQIVVVVAMDEFHLVVVLIFYA